MRLGFKEEDGGPGEISVQGAGRRKKKVRRF
jgi:hypothetical protein